MVAAYAESRISPTLLEAIRADLEAAPWARRLFLLRWRDTAGWRGSYAQASRRLSEWLDEDNPHRFPVEALPDLVVALGHARFLDSLWALEQREQIRQRREGRAHRR